MHQTGITLVKANLLGALLVTQFELAAMSRVNIPEAARRDFFLYVDEFQSFATDSFISILSEARKFRLCLTLSHQYTDQLRPEIRDAVFGIFGSISLPSLSQGKNPSLTGVFPHMQIHASSLPASCVINSFGMARLYHF